MFTQKIVRWASRVILLVCITILSAQTVLAAPAEVVQATTISPYTASMYVPCANHGAGEWVDVSGQYKDVWQQVTKPGDANWYILHIHTTLMGVSGVGRTSGMKYQVSGGWRYTYNTPALPLALNDKFSVQVVGPGKGNHFTYQQFIHFTYNKNGNQVAMERTRVACK